MKRNRPAGIKNGTGFMKQVFKIKRGHHRASHRIFWKGERLYFRGDDYFRDLLTAIGRARRTLDFETYIFEPGRLGDRLALALGRAARRGVKARLLVDGVGSPDFAAHYGPGLVRDGVTFRVYRSWPVIFSAARNFWRLGSVLRKAHSLLGGGNRRDHRKLCLIDDRQVWMGSLNVSDWHLKRLKGGLVWRDTGLKLEGVRSGVFRAAFQLAWEDRWPRSWNPLRRHRLKQWIAHEVTGGPIRLTLTRRLRVLFRRELSRRFESARRRIWILTPYFTPTQSLLRGLVRAARRGCDVRLVLPGPSDVPMARWIALAFYPKLLKAGCRIAEYQGSMLHAKTMMVDDWVLVGSGNLNQRSLRRDLEVNVVLQKETSKRAVTRQFIRDILKSREVTLAVFRQGPFLIRWLSWFFFRFRFWF